MRDSKRLLGEFEQSVLCAVLQNNNDAYGVPVLRTVGEILGRKVTTGAIYNTLDRLEEKGLLTSREGGETNQRGGRRKRYYQLTAAGLIALDSAKRRQAAMWSITPRVPSESS